MAKQLKYITLSIVIVFLQRSQAAAIISPFNLDSLNSLLNKNQKPRERVDWLIELDQTKKKENTIRKH